MNRTKFILSMAGILAATLILSACSSSPDEKSFTFDDIQYCVGEGENRAMLIIKWTDGKSPEALAYGYRWASETKYGYDMVDDIAKADKRLFYLRYRDPAFGYAIAGIGFDASGSSNAKLSNNGGESCESPVDGSIDTYYYDFDDWKLCSGANARWQAGWYDDGYWSYWVSDINDSKWKYSKFGVSSKVLENNSVHAWYFDVNAFTGNNLSTKKCMDEDCDGRDYFGTITPASKPK